MTYQDDVNSGLRNPLTIVKLELDTTITDGGTEYHCDGTVPLGQTFYPSIESIDFAPIRATPLKGLGYRGQLRIKFKDFPDQTNGTYFGRLLGSNPYYLDRKIKIYNGFYNYGDTFSISNFIERTYFLKSIDGPSDKNIVTFECVDILSKLDGDQAIVPTEYEMNLRGGLLKDAITGVTCPALDDSTTDTFTFTNGDKIPNGSNYIVIDSEIIKVFANGTTSVNITGRAQQGTTAASHSSGASVTLSSWVELESSTGTFPTGNVTLRINDEIVNGTMSSDDCNITSRAQYGSEAGDHERYDKVVDCYVKDNVNVVDVLYELIDDYTEIDATTYITQADWNQERDDFLASETIDLVVSESTSVKEVIEDLTSQTYLLMWWDDINQKIRLKSIGPNIASTTQIDYRQHILDVNHRVRTSQLKAINELWVYYNRRDWSNDDEKPKNYQDLFIKIDVDAQTDLGVRKVKKLFADSVRTEATAIKISQRYIAQNKEGYRTITFSLDPVHATIEVGDVIDITSDLDQGSDGNPTTRSYLVVEKEDKGHRIDFKAEATGFLTGESTLYALIAPNSMDNYTLASTDDQDTYAFIADSADDEFSNDDPAKKIL